MKKIGCTRGSTERTQFVLTFKRSNRLILAVAYLVRSLRGKRRDHGSSKEVSRGIREICQSDVGFSDFPTIPSYQFLLNLFRSNNAILPF